MLSRKLTIEELHAKPEWKEIVLKAE